MNASKPARFPFGAVVGHDDAKLALLLAAIDPAIGGVLLRGQKGSAKTTLARGLAALLPGDAPFVDLPLGATEDRLIGTLDLGAVLTGEGRRFEPGLLAAAHGGVLYVDEVNLLPDHLVDVLLDVAASGVNRVEREGISHEHPARFVLIGSMNPEEGELRPQLLDRFGLAVDLTTSLEPRDRAEAVRRRLDFDTDPAAVARRHAPAEHELGARLACAAPAPVPDSLIVRIGALCAAAGVDGLRADLVISRAAASLAGWESRAEATVDDVRRVAPLALAHRQRRTPFDEPQENGLDDALDALDNDDTETPRHRRRPQRRRHRHGTGRRTRCPAATGRPPARDPRPGRCRRAPLTGRWQPRPPDRRPGAGRAGRRRRRRRHRPRRRRASGPGSGRPGGAGRGSARGATRAADGEPARPRGRRIRVDGRTAANGGGEGRRARSARRRLPTA